MKKTLFTLLLLCSHVCYCQIPQSYKFKLKQHALSATMVVLSGAAEGVQDYLQFHYDGNNSFLQPSMSWTNKYKNHDPAQGRRFPGSTTWLAWTTDGWHMAKMAKNLFGVSAVVLHIGEKKKWYYVALEAVAHWILNRISFNIVYNNIKLR